MIYPAPSDAQMSLDAYERDLARTARDTGEASARQADPDGFALVVAEIRRAAWAHETFNADDLDLPVRTNVIGGAFALLVRAGEIVCVGYGVSRRQSRHGGTLRQWSARRLTDEGGGAPP